MNKALFSSVKSEWETPEWLRREIRERYQIDLDVASTSDNKLVDQHYTKEINGLVAPWYGRVYCNPPYGRQVGRWVDKAINEVLSGRSLVIVMLLPARTDTRWFHSLNDNPCCDIKFLRGRLKFTLNGEEQHPAPFPSMLAILEKPL